MKKLLLLKIFLVTLVALTVADGLNAQKSKGARELNITNIELGYPTPGIPFYHFKADLDLPQPSIIEVEAAVDGKVLRATDLKRKSDDEDPNRPPLSERPPSGYGMSLDATLYKELSVVGWVRWEPGKKYDIRISVRLKKTHRASNDDVWITSTKTVTAPLDVPVFDKSWKSYKSVVVSETAGIARTKEPVEVMLAFYPDEAQQLIRDIRVMAVDPKTHELTEVTSQVYDLMEYLTEDDLAPDMNGNPTREIPLWLPTTSVKVAFLADVAPKSSRVFLVFYNNPAAMSKMYETDLRVQGEAPGFQIENNELSLLLHPNSGHLDEIKLKSKSDYPLFHRLETNGAIHWNPDIYVPPSAWTHSSDWKPPRNIQSVIGPVVSRSEVWDNLRGVPEVDASVRYEFHPGVPYFISTTEMRINETVNSISLRNAEMVFKRELFTNAAWYDVVRDSVIVYDITNMADLSDLKMEADVPWITFFNKENGIGFAGIQLEYANASLESPVRLLNPYFYITAGPWIYWARALSHPFLSSNMQQIVPVLKGNMFHEKWAYLVYEANGKDPFAKITEWQKRLTNPLRVQLVEEVDERVSKTLKEVFMDNGKSGWQNRDTHK